MEENEFKQTYQDLVDLPCVFAKALLTRRHTCEKARKVNIAEREAMACASPAAQQLCRQFLALMYDKAQFALQLADKPAQLPHAKLLKLQGGSVRGLEALHQESGAQGVHALLVESLAAYESFDKLPFAVLVRSVGQYKVRGK